MKNSRLLGVAKRRRENTFFQLNAISVEFGLFCDATSAAMRIGTCGRVASALLVETTCIGINGTYA